MLLKNWISNIKIFTFSNCLSFYVTFWNQKFPYFVNLCAKIIHLTINFFFHISFVNFPFFSFIIPKQHPLIVTCLKKIKRHLKSMPFLKNFNVNFSKYFIFVVPLKMEHPSRINFILSLNSHFVIFISACLYVHYLSHLEKWKWKRISTLEILFELCYYYYY